MLFQFLLSLLFLLGLACNKKATDEKKTKNVFLSAKRGDLEDKRTWRGVVRAANRIELRTDRRVKIGAVRATNFSSVKKGDLVVEVDRTEIEKKIQELRDRTASLEVDIKTARINQEHTQKIWKRKKTLLEKGIIAQKDYDEANKAYRLADTSLQTKLLEGEKAKREFAEAQSQLATANFYAPIDGVVSNLFTPQLGQDEVQAGQVIAIVSDPAILALYVNISESQSNTLKLESPAVVTLDALPHEAFAGTLKEVRPLSARDSGGETGTNFQLRIDFDPKDQTIREGFEGKAVVTLQRAKNTLSVPLGAIRYLENKEFVLAAKSANSEPTLKSVTVGIRTEDEAEIKEGISEQDYVVVETI